MASGQEKMKGIVSALVAAALFGASTPFAKALSPRISPVFLAGLLYVGSGVGLSAFWFLRRAIKRSETEAGLKWCDAKLVGLVILFGGLLGPVLLMWGLSRTPASTAALLLNLESVFTALLAWFLFKENFDRRVALGMALIAGGGIAVTWIGTPEFGIPWGALSVSGACLAWAVDNNVTRKLSGSDPVEIAAIKGLAAGTVNVALAATFWAPIPELESALKAALLGFLGYGVSLVLFIYALRFVGTARTGAYFSTAPFIGAAFSFFLLGEKVSAGFYAGAALMALGVYLHLTERHEHLHRHEALEHEHSHYHDEHHQHSHKEGETVTEPHSHPHRHEELIHSHPHYPDLHHRHRH